jgi:predicted extracellular nuclease
LSNGDDVFAITDSGATASSYTIIDIIGEMGDDPGDGWDVAGVTNGTKDHTLVRKSTVTSGNTDWSASAGTTADNSEWIVLDQNTWDYVGSHPHTELEANDPALVITSPESGSTLYSTDVTVSFTVSNFTVATSGGDGHVHYAVDGGTTVMQYTTDDIALTGLSESSHTVIVWLADNSHANLSPHVADTVAFTVSTQTVTSIYDIQFVSDPTTDDASPLDGQTVIISGVVTAEFWGSSSNRYLYVQDAEGPWNGVVCFEYNGWDTFDFVSSTGITNSVAEGDSVTVTGTVDEYYGLTEIVDVTDVIVHGPAVNMISPAVVTTGQIMTGGSDAEAYEGCLVKVENVTVDDADLGNGEWSVTDGTNAMRVDDIWDYYYFPEDGQALLELPAL